MSGPLKAVILDVDGTLVDSERDGHRVAFNQAFEEAGLPDRWEVEHYGRLLALTGGEGRIRNHLAGRGVPDDELDELAPRLHRRKTELFLDLVRDGRIRPRPGVNELVDELARSDLRVAVATTGTRTWVEPLLEQLFGLERFEVVVTGEETPRRKPDPSIYVLALERLGLPAGAVVAVEDSRPGLLAAVGAGVACAVVTNDYTHGEALDEADLVLDGFGTAGSPAAVVRDPLGVDPAGRLDVAGLRRLHERRQAGGGGQAGGAE